MQLGLSQSQGYELEITIPNYIVIEQNDFRVYPDYTLSSGLAYDNISYVNGVWATKSTENSVLWTKFFTSNDPSEYPSSINISKLNTSEDLILSYVVSNLGSNYMTISRLDGTTGSIVWSKKLDYTESYEDSIIDYEYMNINKLSVSDNDEILVTASLTTSMQVVKFTSSGDTIFSRKINNFADDYGKNPGFAFNQTSDGGYIGTFKRDNNPTIAKFGADLSIEWSQLWTIEGYSHPRCAIELDNGKFAIAGTGDDGNFLAILASDGTMESYNILNYSINYPTVTQLKQMNETTLFIGCPNSYYIVDLNAINYQEYNLIEYEMGTIQFDLGNDQLHYFGKYSSAFKKPFMLNFDVMNPICTDYVVSTNTKSPIPIFSGQISDVDFYFKANGIITDFNPTVISGQGTITEACFLGIIDQNETFLSVSPNPAVAGTSISITFENAVQAGESIEIIDLAGRVYQQFTELNQTTSFMLNAALTSGIYLVEHYEKSGQLLSTTKLVVQ